MSDSKRTYFCREFQEGNCSQCGQKKSNKLFEGFLQTKKVLKKGMHKRLKKGSIKVVLSHQQRNRTKSESVNAKESVENAKSVQMDHLNIPPRFLEWESFSDCAFS